MTYMPDLSVAAERIARANWNFAARTGAQAAYTVYTITGDVLVVIFGVCNTAFTGVNATIEVGVVGNTAVLIPQIVASTLIANEIWHDATPTTTVEQISLLTTKGFVVTNGQDAILTVATADLTAGDLDLYALWRPMSTDGNVVAA